MITIRQPRFDFSRTKPVWSNSMEFSHSFNAMSMLFPPLERFLNRVMIKARAQIAGTDADSARIRREIDLFVQQEGVHFAIHTDFNAMLVRNGFAELPRLEADMDKSYGDMLRTKPLRYLVAYCESFEILGPIFANVWLDGIDDLFEGGDPDAVGMFKWHISEEFEHKTVCYDVYHKLFGGYFYRLRAMRRTQKHMGDYIKTVLAYIFEKEWAAMAPEEIAASKKRMRAINLRIGRLAIRHLWRVYLPGYSPRRAKVPKNYESSIGAIEREFMPSAA